MTRPKILDLFSCAGGAGVGYERAGFDVYAVDIAPQPNNPHPFHQADALETLTLLAAGFALQFRRPGNQHGECLTLADFAAIHASPPCQAYSTITPDQSKHPRLIEPVRELLKATGLPYVIENVQGARRELHHPVRVCGSGLGMRVRRHRYFESNVPLMGAPCAHGTQPNPVGVYGDHPDSAEFLRPDGTRRGAKARSLDEAREVMGMPWATWSECAEAIPPRFAEHIGAQLIDHISERAA